MQANSDFKELLRLFADEGVEYLVVGAHAVILYSEPRYTKDFDVWVCPTPANAGRVFRALRRFGAPLTGIEEADFCDVDVVYQMGVAPNRIDVLMAIDGVAFEEAWPNRVQANYDGVPMPVISREDLIRNKRAAGRPQDLLDVERMSQ